MKKIIFMLSGIIASVGVMNAQATRSASELSQGNIPIHNSQKSPLTTATIQYALPVGSHEFTDFEPIESRNATFKTQASTVLSHRGVASVAVFTNRNAFKGAYSGSLVEEDFGNGPGAGVIQSCGYKVSSDGDGCFGQGVLEEGFNITASVSDIAYLGVGSFGNTSALVGANIYEDYTILRFSPNAAYAVGFDLFLMLEPDAEVRVYGTSNNLLDAFTVANILNTESFLGVISSDPIGSVEIQGINNGGELLGNLAFGTDAIVPVDCGGVNPNDGTFETALNCSTFTSFQSANDVVVAADEKFTLENITASIMANGGVTNVDVLYYEDNAGLPGSLIGSEDSVTIDAQNVIGNNFGYDINEIELSVTPFVFEGQVGVPTRYWIELSVTDGGSTDNVYWVVTRSSMEGNPIALFDAGWTVWDIDFDGVYKFEGECDVLLSVADNSLEGFNYYPNPTTGVLKLSANKNIESVAIYNLLGQKVINTNIDAISSELNLSGLSTGTYVMKVSVDGQVGTYKIMKN